jgi:hypothetical protein
MTSAQVRFTSTANTAVSTASAFLDASSNSTNNSSTSLGKGLVFPRVALGTFTFGSATTGIGNAFPSRYDGMIVYNTTDGGVANVGTTSGILAPGFWFYENKSATLTGGTWKPLGSGASTIKDITSTEVVLDRKVNGQQLYAIKGDFTASGSSALISVPVPSGMTGYYSFVVYKDGMTFRNSIVSFNTATSTNNVTTGYSMFTEAYPAGNYSYVLEYFK